MSDGMPVMGDVGWWQRIARMAADLETVTIDRDHLRAEVARLTAERDALRRQAAIGAAVEAVTPQAWAACRTGDELELRLTLGHLDAIGAYRRYALAAGAPVSGDPT